MDPNAIHAGVGKRKQGGAVDLTTSYLGFELTSPLIAGASPLNLDFEATRQMVEAGVGAIVLPSILQEQLIYRSLVRSNPETAIKQSGYAPQQDRYNGGPQEYLKTIQRMKAEYSVPIVASLNAAITGSWLDYAVEIQDSGADALELNWQSGRCDPSETGENVELRLLEWVSQIRSRVTIPIAFKMNPRFTNPASTALRLQNVGVNSLVLFAHHPHWDVDNYRMHWTIGWELTPIGTLGRTLEGLVETHTSGLHIPLAASGGVRTGDDVIKTMFAGADVAMAVSEIYRQGPSVIREMIAGLTRFLETNHHGTLKSFLQSRPTADEHPSYTMRSEIVDPLTSSTNYHDPTPTPVQLKGDSFGHPSH